jgi:tetratricopeptide (TPR) repeat protein
MAYLLGATFLILGSYQEAIPPLQQAVALRPDVGTHYALGNAYYETKQYELALAEDQAAAALDPKDPSPPSAMGDAYSMLKRPAEAIAAYRKALAIKEDPYTHFSLGIELEGQGQTEPAVAEYQASLRLKETAAAHLTLAGLYERTARPDQAIAEYKASLKVEDTAATRAALAHLEELQGHLEDAVTDYKAAIALFPPKSTYQDSARAALARLLPSLCRTDEALTALQPALSGSLNESVELLAALGGVYEAQGKTAEASKVYAAMLQNNADNGSVHYLVSGYYYRQGRLDDAVREMEKATQLPNTFSLEWSALGSLYDLQGNAAAGPAYRKAVESMAFNAPALVGLGQLALKQGQADVALAQVQEALKQQPAYSAYLQQFAPDESQNALFSARLTLAIIYERQGRPAEASAEWTTATKVAESAAAAFPANPQARFQLAVAYWLAGDSGRAETAFSQAGQCDATLISERGRVLDRIAKLRQK